VLLYVGTAPSGTIVDVEAETIVDVEAEVKDVE
jgi:hypothetical protein